MQDTVTLPAYTRRLATRLGAELHELPGNHVLVDPRCESYATVRDVLVSLASGRNRIVPETAPLRAGRFGLVETRCSQRSQLSLTPLVH